MQPPPHPQVQNYHVTVTLLLAASDVLAAAAAQPRQSDAAAAQLQAAAAALAAGVLSRRMKALYFNLSSEVRGKSNAALALLAVLARQVRARLLQGGLPPAAAGHACNIPSV